MSRSSSFIIVGAGVVGRLLAARLRKRNWSVVVYDENGPDGRGSCTWVGAGMLSPYCERVASEPIITELGLRGCERWPADLAELGADVYLRRNGSLVVAHPRDALELERLRNRVIERALPPEAMREAGPDEIGALEPELSGRFTRGLYFPQEGHLDNRELLAELGRVMERLGVETRYHQRVEVIEPGQIRADHVVERADWIVDCRGLGAREDDPRLRGVRGEIAMVEAPEVHLSRPVRLMHPRYSIYVVPRRDQRYLIGATQIESEDAGPVTVRSALELLSAAYTLHSGFAEARVVELASSCRPAYPDNLPRLVARPGLLRINGLYRHGFLLAPVLVDAAITYLERGDRDPAMAALWEVHS
ncbi:MAG: glycine oxidase ThiO [Kiritimatiellae bacterium]|nr:glycine oxidase ThiO [Kiritimatiellia bacterium]MDW8459283.1 glycine oxidase ThiO [Verrucomicrobiota bacterium]